MSAVAMVARIPHQADAAIGCAAREWEGDINDMVDLADIACEVADCNLSKPGEGPVTLTQGQIRRLLFCIYEMSVRAERFKDAYYAALEA